MTDNSHDIKRFNLTEGKVWAVDKPLGWTSFQVVKKLRFLPETSSACTAGMPKR